MEIRGTILQPWNWHSPAVDDNGKNLWQRLLRDAGLIKKMGFTAVWLPPSSHGVGGIDDVGYGIKNWYDLDNTKYGDESQLQQACRALQDNQIQVYHDQVHNHLMGGILKMKSGVCMFNVTTKTNDSMSTTSDFRMTFLPATLG